MLLPSLFVAGLLAGTPAPLFPGNDHSYGISASRDLRYVAFTSNASNLVPGDTNGFPDVFLADRQTGALTRISVDANGIQGDGASVFPSLSADGRYVVFDTGSRTLTGSTGLLRKDLQTGAITQIVVGSGYSPSYPSLSDDGAYATSDVAGFIRFHDIANGTTTNVTTQNFFDDAHPVMSGDGRYIFFASTRTSLVANDTNNASDIFRWERATGIFTRVSLAPGNVQANGQSPPFIMSSRPTNSIRPLAVSADGNILAFVSLATNLTVDPVGPAGGIFVRNLTTGAVTKLATCTGDPFCRLSGLKLTSNGSHLVFHSQYGYFSVNPRNFQAAGYYVANTTTGVVTSIGSMGALQPVFDAAGGTAIADGGATLAFQSTELLPGADDRARYLDVFARAVSGGTSSLLSRGGVGKPGDGHSRQPALSNDGRRVAFASDSTLLVANDTNAYRDVFVRDLSTGATTLVSASAGGTPGDGSSTFPSISGDGNVVAFHSQAENLVPGDVAGDDVYVRVLGTGVVERISADAHDPLGPTALSFDGRWVAYTAGQTLYLYDRVTDAQAIVANPTVDAQPPNEGCNFCETFPLSMSDDGRYVAFGARAFNQAPGQTGPGVDVFVYDRDLNSVELINRGNGAGGTEGTGDAGAPTISGDGRYVAFHASGPNGLVPGAPASISIYLRDRVAFTTTAVGASPQLSNFRGTEPRPIVSRDGGSVAFISSSPAIVPGDSNGQVDLFVWSRESGVTTRSSLSAARSQSDGSAYAYDLDEIGGYPRFFGIAISGDARIVAYSTAATNLALRDDNAADDVIVVQRDAQAIERASAPPVPPQERDLTAPVTTADGTMAVMVSADRAGAYGGTPLPSAADAKLGSGVGNKFSRIVSHDFRTGEQAQVDVSSIGAGANGDSFFPTVAPNGSVATFSSIATNLGGTADGNGRADVFVRDMSANVTVSVTAGGDGHSGRSATTALGDKWSTAFESNAGNLPGAASANGMQDVFVAVEGDTPNAFALQSVSVATGGVAANGPSGDPAITRTGRFVAFSSLATNLAGSDANAASDVFVRDVVTGTTARVSLGTGNAALNGASGQPAIADMPGDKWAAAFESDASNVVGGDTNEDTDVFVRTSDGAVELVSGGLSGAPANGRNGRPAISPDGRFVAFVSTASNLVPGDTNNAPDVFLRDRVLGTTERVSAGAGGQANDFSLQPSVSLDAGGNPLVTWDTAADNLLSGDDDDALDVYQYRAIDDSLTGTNELVFRNGFE